MKESGEPEFRTRANLPNDSSKPFLINQSGLNCTYTRMLNYCEAKL